MAIKRLQASELTLSDIQQRLAGLSPKKLRELASLPSGFWDSAGKFLNCENANRFVDADPMAASPTQRDEFWSDPPSFSDANNCVSISVQLTLDSSVQLIVDVPSGPSSQAIELSSLQNAVPPLIETLRQRGLLKIRDSSFDSTLSWETS